MIRRVSLAAVASLAALAAAACSAPAAPVDSSATTPGATATAAPSASAAPSSPSITFTDSSGSDAGTTPLPVSDGGAAGVCAPQTVTTPTIMWKAPHALHRNVCTPQEAAAIVSCFVQNQNCNVLVSSACHQCAVSGDATPFSSALIVHDQNPSLAPELNVEGCVGEMAGDGSANGCGPKLAAKYQCEQSSCAGCTDATSYQSCAAQSDTGSCATANTTAQCAAPYLGQCVQGTTELEVAYNLVKVFCGP